MRGQKMIGSNYNKYSETHPPEGPMNIMQKEFIPVRVDVLPRSMFCKVLGISPPKVGLFLKTATRV
jgi:hypothetical protein